MRRGAGCGDQETPKNGDGKRGGEERGKESGWREREREREREGGVSQ